MRLLEMRDSIELQVIITFNEIKFIVLEYIVSLAEKHISVSFGLLTTKIV